MSEEHSPKPTETEENTEKDKSSDMNVESTDSKERTESTENGKEETVVNGEVNEAELDEGQNSSEDAKNGEVMEPEEEQPETIESVKEKYEEKLAEQEDRYMRLAAEFENFKKRTSAEMQTRFKYASQPLALNIITGLDNLERALVQAKEEENEQLREFIRGIEMVQQQFYDALKQNDIERTFPKGEPFDPNKHEAMGVVETDEVEPDHIAEVFQAGYTMHDRVIRPAMVQVAKKKQG